MSGVVADTGPLIALAKIELLALPSRLFGQTILPIADTLRASVLTAAGESP